MSSTLYQWNKNAHTRTRGMTLPELLVTIAILSVVSIALMSMIQSFYRQNSFLIEQTSALASARRGINDTMKVIREASAGDDGSYAIASAATSSLTVYADIDQDAFVERVTYSLVNGVLYRGLANATGTPPVYPSLSATTTLATDVRNSSSTPLFTYYDTTGTQLATTSPTISAISSIKVQLLVDLNPNRLPNVFTLTQSATMRNVNKEQ